MNDQQLYEQTLALYDDPAFAKDYAAGIADRVDMWMFEAFLPLVPDGGQVLYIASAGGRDSAYMADHGYEVTGIEQAKALVDLASKQRPDITYMVGDFVQLPFQDAAFDAIWCKAALVHMPSQEMIEQALRGFYRVLRPGGPIMINTKARVGDQAATTTRTDKLSGKERYFRFQDEKEFTALLEAVGFKVLKSKVYNEMHAEQHKNLRDENWLWVLAQKP